jgi:hypothetical protein
MAIKGYKQSETVSVYDPNAGAFREVAIEDLERQLEGLGFTPEQIAERIASLKPKEN